MNGIYTYRRSRGGHRLACHRVLWRENREPAINMVECGGDLSDQPRYIMMPPSAHPSGSGLTSPPNSVAPSLSDTLVEDAAVVGALRYARCACSRAATRSPCRTLATCTDTASLARASADDLCMSTRQTEPNEHRERKWRRVECRQTPPKTDSTMTTRNSPFKSKCLVKVLPQPVTGHAKSAGCFRRSWLALVVLSVVTCGRVTVIRIICFASHNLFAAHSHLCAKSAVLRGRTMV